MLKEYDIIAIGTGSAMNIVSAVAGSQPDLKIAVIDKDRPGGICLTKGCIPTKILLYPAEIIRITERAKLFGINIEIKEIGFKKIMERMRDIIGHDIKNIEEGLSQAKELDYYQAVAEFIAPYTLKVGKEKIKGKTILLCTGSKPKIPPIKGLDKVKYHTSDTILEISTLPKTLCIIGGGYIAAEYGHFFSAMGSEVTILGRNPQFLPQEEPEVSNLAKRELEKHMKIITGAEVREVKKESTGKIKVIAVEKASKETVEVVADEILVATGRSSNSDILHPEKADIETDEHGWIKVNDFLETSQPNIWAFGDATGKYLFKHVANYESIIVYYNAFKNAREKVDYHAVPHAVFTEPEIAGVGMTENEVVEKFGKDNILIGFQRFEDTAKGIAMAVKDYFVKLILHQETSEILGAHIIGPSASVLIQEVINLMYTHDRSVLPLRIGMHIHPALNEVVDRAAGNLMPVDHYHLFLHHYNLQ